MPRPQHRRLFDDLRRLSDPSARYVDMAVAFRPVRKLASGEVRIGTPTPPIGYRWDKWLHCQVGAPETWHTIDVRAESLPLILPRQGVDTDALFGARQASKSYSLATRIILETIVNGGRAGTVNSPTYDKSKAIWQRVLWQLPFAWLAEKPHVSPPATLRMWNGSEVEFRSLDDPDSARSRTIAWAGIDEFGLCSEEAVANVRYSGAIYGDDFRMMVTATPNPKAWLRRWYEERRDGRDPMTRVLHLDLAGNPWAKKSKQDRLRQGFNPRLWRQEGEGLFPEFSTRCYPSFNERLHVVDRAPSGPDATVDFLAAQGWDPADVPVRYLLGHDWGHRQQSTVLFRVWRGPNGRWDVYAEREAISYGSTVEQHVAKVRDLCMRRWPGESAQGYGYPRRLPGLVVADASDAERKHGRHVFEEARFIVSLPTPKGKNPRQSHRIESVNNLLDEVPGSGHPIVRVCRYADADGELIEATPKLRDGLLTLEWSDRSDVPQQVKGTPEQDLTHVPDAAGYLLFKFFAPRIYRLATE